MSFEQALVFYLPPPVFNVSCIFGPVVLTVICFFIVRRIIPSAVLRKHHDIAAAMLGIVGTVYGIFLAFVVATTWQYYNDTSTNMNSEASNIGILYSDATAFSPDFRDAIQKKLKDYRREIIEGSFKHMARGEPNPETGTMLDGITLEYTKYLPKTTTEVAFFQESVRTINILKELRKERDADSSSGLIPLVWFVLIAGGVITIAFSFLFGSENVYVHAVMVALLSLVISLTLFAIVNLDFPFTGQVALSADPFTNLPMN